MHQSLTHIAVSLLTAAAACLPAAAADQPRGQKTFGVYAGYSSRNESAIAGINFTYRFTSHFRLAPSADYTFRHHGEDAFDLSLNAHIPFAIAPACRLAIYPIAGIGYSECKWNTSATLQAYAADSKHRLDRFGINAGAGIELMATPTMRLAAEATWRGRKDFSSAIVSLSIGYVF